MPQRLKGVGVCLLPVCAALPLAPVDAGKAVLGLLRWPQPNQHKAMQLPLVSMQRDGGNLTLLARSVDEYLHRSVLDSAEISLSLLPWFLQANTCSNHTSAASGSYCT